MKPVIVKKARVEHDLAELFDIIALDKIEPALRFLEVAEASFERLAETPGLGVLWKPRDRQLAEVRVYPMPGPYRSYLIFFRAVPNGVDILAVLHGARNLEKVVPEIV